MGASTSPPCQNQDTVTASSENPHTTLDTSHSQQDKRKSPPALSHPPVKFAKTDRSACLHSDGPNSATPAPTGCECLAGGQGPESSEAIIYAPTLLPRVRTAGDIEKTMKDLKELEEMFQADIKRRKIQVEASRPG